MKKVVDYRKDYETLMQKLDALELNKPVRVKYIAAKKEELQKRLELQYYPALCAIAAAQGGRVEFEIDEETNICHLNYTGAGIILKDGFDSEFEFILPIIQDATFFSVHADGKYFVLKFIFI